MIYVIIDKIKFPTRFTVGKFKVFLNFFKELKKF